MERLCLNCEIPLILLTWSGQLRTLAAVLLLVLGHLVAVVAGQHTLGHHDLLLQSIRYTLKINFTYYQLFSCVDFLL